MKFQTAEKFRKPHPLGYKHTKGDDFGWFEVKIPPHGISTLFCMVAPSDFEWKHVSVSKKNGIPTWEEMCFIKDLFFEESEVVVQFHPAKKDYVNLAENCLHLWSYSKEFPTPPRWSV